MAPPSELVEDWGGGTGAGPLERTLQERRSVGLPIIDMIGESPVDHGFQFPPEVLRQAVLTALDAPTVKSYHPESQGQPFALEALSDWYKAQGLHAAPNQLLLTPGTSMGYYYALRLLTRPGDVILVPRPGYPLVDDLAKQCGVGLRSYHMRVREGRWELDIADLEFQITPRTRAIVMISPHNPTGAVVDNATLERVCALCRRHGLTLLFDEVFCETLPGDQVLPRPVLEEFPMAILLNGLSKMCSLPQWKVAWMAVGGIDEKFNQQFMHALIHMADAFLPVTEMGQAMLPQLLTASPAKEWRAAWAERRTLAHQLLADKAPTSNPNAGTYLCLPVPETHHLTDEDLAVLLLKEDGILVHPGYYYGMPGNLVLTIVQRPEVLREVLPKIAARI